MSTPFDPRRIVTAIDCAEAERVCVGLGGALASAPTRAAAQEAIARWRPTFPAPGESERRATRGDDRIGIWQRTVIDDETWFVRDATRDITQWADVERIGPKRGARVALLGESCARGWPLDPFFNCATALTTRLAAEADSVEVVDLAQLAMRPPALLELLDASAVLEPDACVVFAGNNWTIRSDLAPAADLAAIAATGGWRAVKQHCEELLRSQIASWIAELAGILHRRRMPLVFVLPAENIRDFPLAGDLYNPLLISTSQARREELMARIDALELSGRFDESEAIATDLIALEEGCSISGLQALGRCAVARGALADAARWFEQARDLVICLPVYGLSSYTARLEEMRTRLAAAGIPFIDLPALFGQIDGGAPPGRKWFVDECHMTSRGIAVAMAAVAARIGPMIGGDAPSNRTEATPLAIDPRADAQADCVAGLLNSHDPELVAGYCRRALAAWPELASPFREYLDLRLRRVPLELCAAAGRLAEMERWCPALRFLPRDESDRARRSYARDALVTPIIASLIAEQYPDAAAHCDTLLRRKYAVNREVVDVLEHGAAARAAVLGQVPLQPPRAFVRCFRRRLRTHLVSEARPRHWRFALTTRAGHPGAVGRRATLRVNDQVVATWALTVGWTTVHAACLSRREGSEPDEVTIEWPDPGESPEDRLQHLACVVERSASWPELMSQVYTVWGEIHAFGASIGAVNPEHLDNSGM